MRHDLCYRVELILTVPELVHIDGHGMVRLWRFDDLLKVIGSLCLDYTLEGKWVRIKACMM